MEFYIIIIIILLFCVFSLIFYMTHYPLLLTRLLVISHFLLLLLPLSLKLPPYPFTLSASFCNTMFLASSFRLFFKIISFCSPQLFAHTYLSIPYPLKALPFTLFTSIPFYPPPPLLTGCPSSSSPLLSTILLAYLSRRVSFPTPLSPTTTQVICSRSCSYKVKK